MKGSPEQQGSTQVGPDRTLSDLVDDPDDPLEFVDRHPPVALDTVLATIGDAGRRYVLFYLLLADHPVSTAELVDYVASRTDFDERSDRLRRDIAAELVEKQLPELEKTGFIEYNRERQLIGETNQTRTILPFLKLSQEYARRQAPDRDE